MLRGQQLLAWGRTGGDIQFAIGTVSGAADRFATATIELVIRALRAAEDAFLPCG